MQLMPATARRLGVTKAFDPAQNVRGGALYLSRLAERFGEHEVGEGPRRLQRRGRGRRDVRGHPALPGDARLRPEGDGALGGGRARLLSPGSYTPPSCSAPFAGSSTLAPPAFVAALLAYLSAKPRAVSTFTVYPFLAEVLGSGLPRSADGAVRRRDDALLHRPVPRRRRPPLPRRRRRLGRRGALEKGPAARLTPGPRPATLAPEAFWTLVATSLLLAAVAGARLPGVAHGGELPGGVNVAPAFVAAVPFVAVGCGPSPGVPRVDPEGRRAPREAPVRPGPRAMIAA